MPSHWSPIFCIQDAEEELQEEEEARARLVEVVVVTKCDGSTKKGQSQERESGKVRHAIAACLLVA